MLTPKCPARDFRVRARENSTRNRLYRSESNLRVRNEAGIREEFGGLAKYKKLFYINDLWWLCWEAAENGSLPGEFPDSRENTGNFTEIGKSRTLGASTHKALLVEFPTRRNREYTDANSEFSLR